VAPPASTSTTIDTPVGAQAFQVYQQAFALLIQIEGDPRGSATDPRLGDIMIDPWYAEVRAGINQLRLKREVVKGPYSFSKFRLDDVTPDGRVIFTDCQTNSQEIYSSATGAAVTNSGTGEIHEQIVVYHPTQSVWKVADRNTGTTGAVQACAG
jgi:hypothetical protein